MRSGVGALCADKDPPTPNPSRHSQVLVWGGEDAYKGNTVKIKSIEPIAISLPMLKPVIMAGEEIRRADNVLVRIETDSGAIGWGEAASAPVMTGDTLESIVAAVHLLEPALRGREPADIEGALAAMDGRMYGNTGAKAAIEIALHDLVGRATGRPVHALLGDKKRNKMPLLAVVGGGDFDGDLRDAEKKKAAGFTAFKIKVGVDTSAKDAERTRAVCKILGSGLLISADANQGFSAEEALAYVRAVERAAASISSNSRSRRTISTAWRRHKPRPPRSPSAPTKASTASTTSSGITTARRRAASA